MKIIKGDLILKEDTIYDEDIKVFGNIRGDYNLKVIGNIYCWDINCQYIDFWNINCQNIICWNINCQNIICQNIICLNINCENINCWEFILCNKIKVEEKCIAKGLIKDKCNLERKEQIKEQKR